MRSRRRPSAHSGSCRRPRTMAPKTATLAWPRSTRSGRISSSATKELPEPGSVRGQALLRGRPRRQPTPVDGSFYDREILLNSGESGYDAYVGATGYLTSVQDGTIVATRGLLAAKGETERPGEGGVLRSIYLLATEENGGEVDSLDPATE